MLKYTFVLSHDKGYKTMSVVATSLDNAIDMIYKFENCPKSAISLKSIYPHIKK